VIALGDDVEDADRVEDPADVGAQAARLEAAALPAPG